MDIFLYINNMSEEILEVIEEEEEEDYRNYMTYLQIREYILLLQPFYYVIINLILTVCLLSYVNVIKYGIGIYLLSIIKYFINSFTLKIVRHIQTNDDIDVGSIRSSIYVYMSAVILNLMWILTVPIVAVYTFYSITKMKYLYICILFIYTIDILLYISYGLIIICIRFNHNCVISCMNILYRRNSRLVSINNITTKIYSSIHEDEETGLLQQNCSICLAEYEDEDEIKVLQCDHIFHKECIDRWLFINFTCPICRQDPI